MHNLKMMAASVLATSVLLTGCGANQEEKVQPAPSPSVSSSSTPSATASVTPSPAQPAPTTASAPAPATGDALTALNKLPVKDADTSVKYNRELFGEPWEDIDGNGCDTRNDMLLRDLKNITVDANECTVLLGTLVDPYTGTTVNFDRSKGGGGGIDIDHVIALSASFRTGSATWDADKRLHFANDPLNLLPSGSGPNRAKGDKDASEWLPATAGNASYNCTYVARQVAVKTKYALWLTPAEKNAMDGVLETCPEEKLPNDKDALVDSPAAEENASPAAPAPAKAPAKAPAAPAPAPVPGKTDPNYGSCAKAKAAGAGPYTKGQPEYAFYRDGDGDGTVCE